MFLVNIVGSFTFFVEIHVFIIHFLIGFFQEEEIKLKPVIAFDVGMLQI